MKPEYRLHLVTAASRSRDDEASVTPFPGRQVPYAEWSQRRILRPACFNRNDEDDAEAGPDEEFTLTPLPPAA